MAAASTRLRTAARQSRPATTRHQTQERVRDAAERATRHTAPRHHGHAALRRNTQRSSPNHKPEEPTAAATVVAVESEALTPHSVNASSREGGHASGNAPRSAHHAEDPPVSHLLRVGAVAIQRKSFRGPSCGRARVVEGKGVAHGRRRVPTHQPRPATKLNIKTRNHFSLKPLIRWRHIGTIQSCPGCPVALAVHEVRKGLLYVSNSSARGSR